MINGLISFVLKQFFFFFFSAFLVFLQVSTEMVPIQFPIIQNSVIQVK